MGGFVRGLLLIGVGWFAAKFAKKPASRAPPPDPTPEEEDTSLFEFTEARRYDLYVERRKRYSDAAREAYHRLHQAIIGVSAGSVVLSITFLKDVAKEPVSLGWLVAAWGFVLVGSLIAFFALIASAEGDRERIVQIDCLARTSQCDESRADRLGVWTGRFNYASVSLCIIGVMCMIVFATANVLHLGDSTWQRREKTSTENPEGLETLSRNVTIIQDAPSLPNEKSSKAAETERLQPVIPSSSTRTPSPIPATQSQRP